MFCLRLDAIIQESFILTNENILSRYLRALNVLQACAIQQLFRNLNWMSEEQEQVESGEEEEEQEDEEEDGDDEDEEDGDDDQDEDDDDQENQDQDQDQNEEGDEQGEEEEEEQKPVPTFQPVSQQFVFRNLLAQIASIGNSVDHFINTLPSRGGSAYRSYQPRIEPQYKPRLSEPVVQEKKYTIMKDQDIQVSMQPQIIIQQTLTPKEQPKKQPYRISNESTKFLAQLYEENKKLKRWQNTQTGNGSTWGRSKEKFERPEHERGLINLEDRNKEIDQAIEMLRREDNQ